MSGLHGSVVAEYNWNKIASTRWFGNRERGIAIDQAIERAESCWEIEVVKRNHGNKELRHLYYVGAQLPKTCHGNGRYHGSRIIVDRGVACDREKGE